MVITMVLNVMKFMEKKKKVWMTHMHTYSVQAFECTSVDAITSLPLTDY